MLHLTLVFYTCIYRFYILHLCTLVQHWYKCYLYLCVVFENGALQINTCACVVLVLCGAKFDSEKNPFSIDSLTSSIVFYSVLRVLLRLRIPLRLLVLLIMILILFRLLLRRLFLFFLFVFLLRLL